MVVFRQDVRTIVWQQLKTIEARRDETAAWVTRLRQHGHRTEAAEKLLAAFQDRVRLLETRLRSIGPR